MIDNVPNDIEDTYLKEALAAFLYHNDKMSLKQARSMIGVSRREFEETILPKFGFTTMSNSPDDVEIEIMASKR